MSNPSVRLVLCARQEKQIFNEVRERLLSLGYLLNTKLEGCGLIADTELAYDAAVLIAGQPDDAWSMEWKNLIGPRPSLPTLGVFAEPHGWKSETLSACQDFVSWPCQAFELEARLARMLDQYAPPTQAGADQALLDWALGLNMVGESPQFLGMLDLIKRVSKYEAPLLLQGETGTGKELVARSVHYLSPRGNQPFVPVNCGALPDGLVENELFGHERGAYTDAGAARSGLVDYAGRGTLFLDEIDELSPRGQVVLLRFLQNMEYRPLGADRTKTANVRVIAASNADLEAMIYQGGFRQDLYHRINTLKIIVPPLRQRKEDIATLACYFLRCCAEQYSAPPKELSPASLTILENQPWPGNIRELQNLMQRAFMLSQSRLIHLPSLSGLLDGLPHGAPLADVCEETPPFNQSKAQAINEFERNYLVHLMRRAEGNVSQAARLAGKERRALGRLLKKHGLSAQRPV